MLSAEYVSIDLLTSRDHTYNLNIFYIYFFHMNKNILFLLLKLYKLELNKLEFLYLNKI